jgi:hypothetical protein
MKLISAFKNHYTKLNKFHRASYLFYGTFYFLNISHFVIYRISLLDNFLPYYSFGLFKTLVTCIFGIAGIVCFFKGKIKNAD